MNQNPHTHTHPGRAYVWFDGMASTSLHSSRPFSHSQLRFHRQLLPSNHRLLSNSQASQPVNSIFPLIHVMIGLSGSSWILNLTKSPVLSSERFDCDCWQQSDIKECLGRGRRSPGRGVTSSYPTLWKYANHTKPLPLLYYLYNMYVPTTTTTLLMIMMMARPSIMTQCLNVMGLGDVLCFHRALSRQRTVRPDAGEMGHSKTMRLSLK